MKKFGFGQLEVSIIQVMRGKGRVSVREVYTALGYEGSYTTMMTVMSRMAQKGELCREKEGKQYVYWMPQEKQGVAKNVFEKMGEKLFGGRVGAMVSYLLETDQAMTEEELSDMERLIQKKRDEQQRG